jgi:hypothetical protein
MNEITKLVIVYDNLDEILDKSSDSENNNFLNFTELIFTQNQILYQYLDNSLNNISNYLSFFNGNEFETSFKLNVPHYKINQNIKNNNILNINSINNINTNTNQNTSNIFNNQNYTNNPSVSINNQLTNNNTNIFSQMNKNEIKKEEKKEELNVFLAQSNQILNKSNNNKEQNQNNNQIKNSIQPQISKNNNNNNNINIIKPILDKNGNSKAKDFINNLFVDDTLIFSENERKDFEKNQLSYKLNEDIVDEFKTMLFNQKERFEKFVHNERIYEQRYTNLVNNINKNSNELLNNGIKMKKLSEKIKSVESKYTDLNLKMTNRDKAVTRAINYIEKNLNNGNSLSIMKSKNFLEKYGFYKEMGETSDKIESINKNLNTSWNSICKIEDSKNVTDFIYNEELEKRKIRMNNFNMDGIFIERNELDIKKKIYVEQNDIDNIFNECYEGLFSLKRMQDEIDNKYNLLKNKLIIKNNENNDNIKRNIQNDDINIDFNI